jgi:hypothetical protein
MELLLDSILDTLKMIPFLIVTFTLIEFLEHKFGEGLYEKVKGTGKYGPVVGALLGIIPQCGFSVVAVAFYVRGYITFGTLISIFIATSDEAIPILISTPGAMSKILPFLLLKIIFAIFWGYLFDIILNHRKLKVKKVKIENHAGCCGEECVYRSFRFIDILGHSSIRTLKIGIYIFIITFGLGVIINYTSIQTFAGSVYRSSYMQIGITSIIGLIPNCAISVGLVQTYLIGIISFASVMAGLSSNAGLAILVLFREVKNKVEVVLVTGALLIASYCTGLIIYLAL